MVDDNLLMEFKTLHEKECGKLFTKENFKSPKAYNELTDKGKYCTDVFWKYLDLLNLRNDMLLSIKLIKNMKSYKIYKDADTDSYKILDYNVEHYFYKLYTVHEIMKLSINKVYKLGFKEKDCKWGQLKKGNNNSVLFIMAEKYFNDFDFFMNKRHFNTHRNIEILTLDRHEGLFRGMYLTFFKTKNEKLDEALDLLKQAFKEKRRDVLSFLDDTQLKVDKYICDFQNNILKEAISILKAENL